MTFFLSAIAGIIGFVMTMVFLPETTGLSLDELDRMVRACVLFCVCVYVCARVRVCE